ncbi:MAG: alpha-amylase family glycosyl hydrolase [Terriglobia bacterium]
MGKTPALQATSLFRTHPHLYEINTWAWIEEITRRYDRPVCLGSVPEEEWDKFKQMGFDAIWLMGVWKRSVAGRTIFRTDLGAFAAFDAALPGWTLADVVGSPYAIGDYVPDPHFGGWDDLDRARDALRRRGIRLILDFVPNHTGIDHPWVGAHPEFYVQGKLEDFRKHPSEFFLAEQGQSAAFIAHGKDPYFPAWPDTAQLNYYNPALREAMLGILRSIALHADGIRCDMAMLPLNDVFARTWGSLLAGFKTPQEEFWPAAVALLPNFVWIGEVYWDLEWRMQQLGMTYTYDKRLYDRLRSCPPAEVRLHLKAGPGYQSRLVRFLENHDEARAVQAFGREKLRAAATLAATLPGMRFYHEGQLEGKKLHLPIQLRRAANETPDPEIQALYSKLLAMTQEKVFHEGEWKLLDATPAGDTSFDNLIAYQWQTADALKVVVANLSQDPSRGQLLLSSRPRRRGRCVFFDQLSGKSYEQDGRDFAENGLAINLDGFGSQILDLSP